VTGAPDAPDGRLRLADLDFELPADLVAQRPAAQRDACRLLHVGRGSRADPEERRFDALPELLRPGDALVRNVTRVLPARLRCTRPHGGRGEILLLEPEPGGGWWALVRPGRRLAAGSSVRLDDDTPVEIAAVDADGRRLVRFPPATDVVQLARNVGVMPLPPYIERPADAADTEDYQTVYARIDGSVAAPTAGLHFTPALLARLEAAGVLLLDLVLHVGPGTFQPIRSPDPLQHRMHWEPFAVQRSVLERLRAVRAAGGRVVGVGTTVARTLESVGRWEAGEAGDEVVVEAHDDVVRGRTRLFLYPPRRVRCLDALLTNFHLPRTTLLLLVDAFAGRDTRRRAYAWAVQHRFRFFSYGDAMLID
jgi:S-adenosylmethionine:tRNA ribosyltransferase-isomerase